MELTGHLGGRIVAVTTEQPSYELPSGSTFQLKDSTSSTVLFSVAESGAVSIGKSGQTITVAGNLNVSAYALEDDESLTLGTGNDASIKWANTAKELLIDLASASDTTSRKIKFNVQANSGSGSHTFEVASSNFTVTGSRVGIGTTTPSDHPDEKNDLVIGDQSGHRGMTIASGATSIGTIRFAPSTAANSGEGWIDYSNNSKAMRFGTDGLNTRLTIDSSGDLTIAGKISGVTDPSDAQDAATKAYVDAQVTASDLDFQGDSGGALSIDLDSETLTVAGGSGVTTTGSGNTLTIATDAAQGHVTSLGTLTALTGGTGDLKWDSGTLFVDASLHKVGIGTTSPGDHPDEKDDLVIGDQSGHRGMTIASGATSVGTIRFAPSTAANSGEGWIDYSNNTKAMRFGTNGLNTRLIIDTSGKVGIGTATPAGKLDVTHSFATADLDEDEFVVSSVLVNRTDALGDEEELYGLMVEVKGHASDHSGSSITAFEAICDTTSGSATKYAFTAAAGFTYGLVLGNNIPAVWEDAGENVVGQINFNDTSDKFEFKLDRNSTSNSEVTITATNSGSGTAQISLVADEGIKHSTVLEGTVQSSAGDIPHGSFTYAPIKVITDTSSTVTITIPTAQNVAGRRFTFMNVGSGGNNVTIATQGVGNLVGTATIADGTCCVFWCDGSKWYRQV